MQESHSIFTGVINYNNYNNWHIHPMERKIKKQQEAGRQPPRNTCRPACPAEQGGKRLSKVFIPNLEAKNQGKHSRGLLL